MSFSQLSICSLIVILASLCGQAVAGGDTPSVYDMNSWKQLIGADCKAYFDGCNNCVGSGDGRVAACTRMACAVYQSPRCLDDEADVGGSAAASAGKTVDYACDQGATFSVIYHEYVQGDQRVRLGESEVMLRDDQTHSVHRLRRERSASGEQYADAGGFLFFAKGDGALVMQQNKRLYSDCAVKQ